MASHPRPALVSPEEYLAFERASEERHELVDGEIRAMTGGSRAHGTFVVNIAAALHTQLRGGPCAVLTQSMRVRVEASRSYFYPDVVAYCGEPRTEDAHEDSLLEPVMIVEVLSPSTTDYDHGRKWEHYRKLPSLREYLLVSQEEPRVERFARQGEIAWLFSEVAGLDAALGLESVGASLALEDVYERVFP